jgi:hypothetical protein
MKWGYHIWHIPITPYVLIRCNANYYVTTWCLMQTVVWMAYSDYSHFSEQLSYKILCISSYGSKDINFARFDHFLLFSEKQRKCWKFSHPHGSTWRDWSAGPGCWLGLRLLRGMDGGWRAGPSCQRAINKKCGIFGHGRIRTPDLLCGIKGSDHCGNQRRLSICGNWSLRSK